MFYISYLNIGFLLTGSPPQLFTLLVRKLYYYDTEELLLVFRNDCCHYTNEQINDLVMVFCIFLFPSNN